MKSFHGLYKTAIGSQSVSINSEQYQAILRLRLRKFLLRRGVPIELFKSIRTKKELFELAKRIKPSVAISNA